MKEERKRILKMVEDGKLTVDEALSLLEELEKSTKTMEQKQEQLVNELSTVVQNDSGNTKKESKSQQTFHSTKDKLFDFVDTAIKKIKDFDLDLNFGNHIDISHIFQQTEPNVKYIDIDVANGNVRVLPWDQKDVRVECEAQVFKGQTQEEAKEHFLKEITFEVREDRLYFLTNQKWIKLDTVVYIPEADYEQMEIRLFNGAIEGKDVSVKKVKVKTANGKITMDGIRGDEVEAETANGAIHFTRCKVADIEAETLNGAIKLQGDLRKAELQSFNGNIQCTLEDPNCEIIDAKTTTGAIEITVPAVVAVNGELKSNLGNFKVDLDSIQIVEEKSELIQKTMIFKSEKDTTDILRVYADTKTGSIAVKKKSEI